MLHWLKANGEVSILTPESSKQTGQMLKAENKASREYVYEYLHDPSRAPEPDFNWGNIKPIGEFRTGPILRAADYYEYQSSQHPNWWDSDARGFIECLRRVAWAMLPEYQRAPWGTPDHVRAFYVKDEEQDTGKGE